MSTMKNIAMMAMGSAVTLAYQKYNKPVKNAVKKAFNKTMQKADNKLDEMM